MIDCSDKVFRSYLHQNISNSAHHKSWLGSEKSSVILIRLLGSPVFHVILGMPVLGTSRPTNGERCPRFIFLLALSVSGAKEHPIALRLLQRHCERFLIILWHWFLLFLWPV